jgi:uncharacterized protein YecT (DUF1311 family)
MSPTRLSLLALAPVALAVLSARPVAALAQMQACAGLQTQTEMNACAAREYQKHDAAMNELYQKLLARLNQRQRALAEDAENAWIGYRDKQCAFQTSGAGGTIRPLIQYDCLDEKTNVHAAELNRQLNCQEGDPSCVR